MDTASFVLLHYRCTSQRRVFAVLMFKWNKIQRMSVKHFFTLIFLVAAFGARAQRVAPADTVLKGSTIEVIQTYKPEVKRAPKPEWVPQLPATDTTHPVLSLEVPQQTLYYTYSSQPLRPLALGKDIPKPPVPSYVALGGGNLSTIYLDAGTSILTGENYETGLHLHHLSQAGGVLNQFTALSGAEAEGMYHAAKSDWHARLMAERNQYAYYGYDHTIYDYAADSVKQVYTSVRAIVDMANKSDSGSRFFYHPSITASVYTAKMKTSEISAGLDLPFRYSIDTSLDAVATLSGNVTNFKSGSFNTFNNVAELKPGIVLHHGPKSGHALLGLAIGGDGTGYLLPDILASYVLPDTRYVVTAGWQALLRQNTYEQLTTENPYMLADYYLRQTKNDEVFLGLAGPVGDHFIFSARGSWWNFNTLPTFLNDTGDHKQFYVQYDNVKAFSIHVAVRYTQASIWSVGATADYYAFYGGTEKYVWHEPNVRMKGDLTVNVTKKFVARTYFSLLSGIHSRDSLGNTHTLKAIADLGVNAEYTIIPRLSVFAELDNIFNKKYERWAGYQSYGINIYGGLRMKF